MRIQEYLDYLRDVKRYSPRTLAAYAMDLSRFAAFCGLEETTSDFSGVTPKMVREWLMAEMGGHLRTDKPGKRLLAASGRRKLSSVKVFFHFLVREGELECSPVEGVRGPRLPGRLPVYLDEEQMDALLDGRQEAGIVDFPGLRDWLLLLMLYDTGMRRCEIISLRVNEVDLSRRVIRVRGKGDRQREIPMIEELAAGAACYLESRREVVRHEHGQFFVTNAGKPLNASFVYRRVTRLLREVTTLSTCSPHVLRHTCATHLLKSGASIQGIKELLGHSSLAATQVYTHVSVENMLKVFKQAHPRA
jgi:integrase/recombinase XerC